MRRGGVYAYGLYVDSLRKNVFQARD